MIPSAWIPEGWLEEKVPRLRKTILAWKDGLNVQCKKQVDDRVRKLHPHAQQQTVRIAIDRTRRDVIPLGTGTVFF